MNLETITALKTSILEASQQNPWILFVALVFLPGFGCPSSALLLLAGIVWGSNATGCALAILATAINLTWTYWVAAYPGQKILTRILRSRGEKWREMGRTEPKKLIVILRVTPGIPLCIQNYTLGLLSVPFLPYLALSIPINGMFVIGYILTGGAILKGSLTSGIAAIAVLIAATLVVRSMRNKLAPKIEPAP